MRTQQATTLSSESIELFQSSLYGKGRSRHTIKGYSTDLRVLLSEVNEVEILQEELEEIGQNWLTANRKKVAPKTTQRRLTSLRTWSKWAGWGDLFDDYSAPTPAQAVPHPLPEGMAGVERLIEVAGKPEYAALVGFCGMCGLRIAEALAVRPSHIDIKNMVLMVYGKGDKMRRVPISEKAWAALASAVTSAFLNDDALVIDLQDRFARRVITNLGRKAGLQRPISSHDLRATFATEVYNRTLDRRVVQDLLGHAHGDTTDVYIARTEEQKREAVEKL